MAKDTLTHRVELVEGHCKDLDDRIEREFSDLKSWLGNGFSIRVSQIVTERLAEHQAKEWTRERQERELQIKEKEIRDRSYGAERDRKTKTTLALLTPLGVAVAGAIGAIVAKVVGG